MQKIIRPIPLDKAKCEKIEEEVDEKDIEMEGDIDVAAEVDINN
jgi:hypothetical protein